VADIETVRDFVARTGGLATVSVARDDGSVQSTLVNAGTLAHPVSGADVVGLVVRADTVKLRRARRHPSLTVSWRDGWQWVTVEGQVTIAGPDDQLEGFTGDIPTLLRDVFKACGGTHDDWDAYDTVMAEERRTALLIEPSRIYSNPGS
jgi:PPOX class probable F420-dependent enzyme